MPTDHTKLDAVGFDRLLSEQDPFAVAKVDLSECGLITPPGIVQTAAACHAIAQSGRIPTVHLPPEPVLGYLGRAGLLTLLEPFTRFEPPLNASDTTGWEDLRGNSPVLIEVTAIETAANLRALLDRVVAALQDHLGYSPDQAFDVAVAVSEICSNMLDHAPDAAGFIAMQGYEGGNGRFLEVAVADCGPGIRESLSANPEHAGIKTDRTAILNAFKSGVSSTTDRTRGTGLHHLIQIAFRYRGSLHVRSGTAAVRYRMDRRAGWTFRVTYLPGTSVSLSLPQPA